MLLQHSPQRSLDVMLLLLPSSLAESMDGFSILAKASSHSLLYVGCLFTPVCPEVSYLTPLVPPFTPESAPVWIICSPTCRGTGDKQRHGAPLRAAITLGGVGG